MLLSLPRSLSGFMVSIIASSAAAPARDSAGVLSSGGAGSSVCMERYGVPTNASALMQVVRHTVNFEACQQRCESDENCVDLAYDASTTACQMRRSEQAPKRIQNEPRVKRCMHEGMRPALPERDATQLQAHEFEMVSDEVIKTLDGDSMMFCLGTGKTGTETLKDVFDALGWEPSRTQCEKRPFVREWICQWHLLDAPAV